MIGYNYNLYNINNIIALGVILILVKLQNS
jgi:hypothetical protein